MSFLLPARNAADSVQEALGGVLAQRDAPPFEVVCVDDASTDATPRLLVAAAARDARVRIVSGEGRGLVAALTTGLRACRGELIARMDADDVVEPDRLSAQLALLESHPRVGAVGSLVRCFPESPGLARLEAFLNSTVTPEQCANARFIEAPLVHPSITLRRAALEDAGGFLDHGWAEDWDLLLRLVERGWELAKVPRVLLHWRDSEGRLTRTGAAYRPEQMMRLRAHYLARGPLRDRPFDVWGAGPSGKRLARELEAHGLRPRAFYDLAPGKRVARGLPVLPEAALPAPSEALLLCVVGVPSARAEIRAMLAPRGYLEGRHFLFAA